MYGFRMKISDLSLAIVQAKALRTSYCEAMIGKGPHGEKFSAG